MPVPVSVVIPYRDAQAYVFQALDSVRQQTVSPAEIILVDDASTHPAETVVSPEHGRVRMMRLEENRGPGPARNAGVAAATQPYIAFLDADDLWMPQKLEIQYGFMRAWPELDATHTEVAYFFSDGREISRPAGPRELSVATALSNHVMMTPSVMIKRASFERIGGFDPSFRCTQDWEMQIRMAEAGFRIQYLPNVLTRVRRENHGSHSANWKCYLAGHLRLLWKHRDAYRARGGRRFWIHRVAYECWRAGHRSGGLFGSLLRLPYRVGV